MKIVLISDTHGLHDRVKLPDGDILIHAGDFMNGGRDPREAQAFMQWFASQPHDYKIFIAGNHDFLAQDHPFVFGEQRTHLEDITYLQDGATVVCGLKIYGSPWQPEYYNWAFNLPRGEALKAKWDLIPPDTDIIVTHGPPERILDRTPIGMDVGCDELRSAVKRIAPKLHVFGHVHNSYGIVQHNDTIFVNASICNEQYRPVNAPIVVEL